MAHLALHRAKVGRRLASSAAESLESSIFPSIFSSRAPQPAAAVVQGDYCNKCSMVGHAANACTTFTGQKAEEPNRLGTTLDWECGNMVPNMAFGFTG